MSGSWITAPVKKEMLNSINKVIENSNEGVSTIGQTIKMLGGVARVSGMRGIIMFLDDFLFAINEGHLTDKDVPTVVIPALVVLSKYLEKEIDGSTVSPILLFKAYSAILKASNKDIPYEGVMFYPSISYNGYGDHELNQNQVSSDAFMQMSDLYLSSFKDGLNTFNSGDRKAGISAMRQSMITLETKNPHQSLRLFFDAGIAALDALRGESAESGDFVVFTMMLDAIREFSNGASTVSDSVISSLLFVVARRRRQNARSKRINNHLGTDALIASISSGNVEGFKLSIKQRDYVKTLIAQMEAESSDAMNGNYEKFLEACVNAGALSGAPDPLLSMIGESMNIIKQAFENRADPIKVVAESAVIISILQDLVDGNRNENQAVIVSRQKNILSSFAGIEAVAEVEETALTALGDDSGHHLMGEVRAELNLVELVADSIANGTLDDAQKLSLSKSFVTIKGAMSIFGNNDAVKLVDLLSAAINQNEESKRSSIVDGVGYLSSYVDAYRSGAKDAGSLIKKGIYLFEEDSRVSTVYAQSEGDLDIPNDDFLLEVFIEESNSVIESLSASLSIIEKGDNKEEMVNIRRSFHTLKGSSRMVGLKNFGECAWQAEQVMNKWNAENLPVTEGLIKFIEMMKGNLTSWITSFEKEKSASISSAQITSKAAKLMNGDKEESSQADIDVETAIASDIPPETDTPPESDGGYVGALEIAVPSMVNIPDVILEQDPIAADPESTLESNYEEPLTLDTVAEETNVINEEVSAIEITNDVNEIETTTEYSENTMEFSVSDISFANEPEEDAPAVTEMLNMSLSENEYPSAPVKAEDAVDVEISVNDEQKSSISGFNLEIPSDVLTTFEPDLVYTGTKKEAQLDSDASTPASEGSGLSDFDLKFEADDEVAAADNIIEPTSIEEDIALEEAAVIVKNNIIGAESVAEDDLVFNLEPVVSDELPQVADVVTEDKKDIPVLDKPVIKMIIEDEDPLKQKAMEEFNKKVAQSVPSVKETPKPASKSSNTSGKPDAKSTGTASKSKQASSSGKSGKKVVKKSKKKEYVPPWMPNWMANAFRFIGRIIKK